MPPKKAPAMTPAKAPAAKDAGKGKAKGKAAAPAAVADITDTVPAAQPLPDTTDPELAGLPDTADAAAEPRVADTEQGGTVDAQPLQAAELVAGVADEREPAAPPAVEGGEQPPEMAAAADAEQQAALPDLADSQQEPETAPAEQEGHPADQDTGVSAEEADTPLEDTSAAVADLAGEDAPSEPTVQAADGPGALADDASETAHQQGEDATACTTDRNGAGDETDVLPTERTQLSGEASQSVAEEPTEDSLARTSSREPQDGGEPARAASRVRFSGDPEDELARSGSRVRFSGGEQLQAPPQDPAAETTEEAAREAAPPAEGAEAEEEPDWGALCAAAEAAGAQLRAKMQPLQQQLCGMFAARARAGKTLPVPPDQLHAASQRTRLIALVDTWHQLQARRAQEASGRGQELAQLDAQIEQATAQEQEMAAQLAAAQKEAVKGARVGSHAASRQGCGPVLEALQARQAQIRDVLAEQLSAEHELAGLELETAAREERGPGMVSQELSMQEELGSGLRLLDLEQLQLEAQNAASTLAAREADKATMTSLKRQAVQIMAHVKLKLHQQQGVHEKLQAELEAERERTAQARNQDTTAKLAQSNSAKRAARAREMETTFGAASLLQDYQEQQEKNLALKERLAQLSNTMAAVRRAGSLTHPSTHPSKQLLETC